LLVKLEKLRGLKVFARPPPRPPDLPSLPFFFTSRGGKWGQGGCRGAIGDGSTLLGVACKGSIKSLIGNCG